MQGEQSPALSPAKAFATLLQAFNPTGISHGLAGGRLSVTSARARHGQRAPVMQLEVGSPMPSVEIDKGFPPEKVNVAELTKGKKVIMVGLPGAFTPT